MTNDEKRKKSIYVLIKYLNLIRVTMGFMRYRAANFVSGPLISLVYLFSIYPFRV